MRASWVALCGISALGFWSACSDGFEPAAGTGGKSGDSGSDSDANSGSGGGSGGDSSATGGNAGQSGGGGSAGSETDGEVDAGKPCEKIADCGDPTSLVCDPKTKTCEPFQCTESQACSSGEHCVFQSDNPKVGVCRPTCEMGAVPNLLTENKARSIGYA